MTVCVRRPWLLLFLLGWQANLGLAAPPAPIPEEELLRSHKVGTDGPALLDFFRKRTLTGNDRQTIQDLVGRLGSRSFAQREQAERQLREKGPAVLAVLREGAKSADLEVARRSTRLLEELTQVPGPTLPTAAVRVLVRRAPTESVPVLLAYVPYADDDSVREVVLDGILTLSPASSKPHPGLVTALKDEFPARRAVAAAVLGRHAEASLRAAVRPLLQDADAEVRFQAGLALALSNQREGVAPLIALLADAPLARGWQIEEMLYRLAGETGPTTTLGDGSKEARIKCREVWAAWWRKHEASADLKRLTSAENLLGLTVTVEYNTNRIWECGPDGTYRWEMSVQGPMDARVVPGNRVLVASDQGATERDFQGKVLTQFAGTNGATSCQRLRNGHTFVSTYSGVMEFDREGKQIYSQSIRGSNAIRKSRSGHVIYTIERAVVEMSVDGKEVRQIPLPAGFWVGLEDLPGDRFLLADSNGGRVLEIDAKGAIVWEGKLSGACGVARLPNGNTLVAGPQRVVELNRAGKEVWEKKVTGYARRVHRR